MMSINKTTPKESYKTQKNTAQGNENKILRSLLEHPKTFTELKAELGLSPRGITKILERMKESKLIENMPYSRAYQLTKKGKRNAKAIPVLLYQIENIMEGKYNYSSEMGEYSLGYKGISSDVLYDTDIPSGIVKLFKDVFRKDFKNILKEPDSIPDIIKDETELKGKLVLAITIDLNSIKKQFLNRNNKEWKNFEIKWKNEEKWSKLFRDDSK